MGIENRNYLLHIELLEIEPKIWRKFIVPGFISLDRLHDVIQIVMGWKDYHLFEFIIGNKKYTEDPEEIEQGKDAAEFRLIDLAKKKAVNSVIFTISEMVGSIKSSLKTVATNGKKTIDPVLDSVVTRLRPIAKCTEYE